MPELPEVETVLRGIAPRMIGRRLVEVEARRPDLRRPLPAGFVQRLTGRAVIAADRRAKYLRLHLEGGETLIVHLGMSGRLVIEDAPPPVAFHHGPSTAVADAPHTHVVFRLDDGTRILFADPRRFGLMDIAVTDDLDAHDLFAHLGPEPLGNGFSGPYLARVFEGRRAPVKALLLDQRVVVGVGNIYASESLFEAGIHPARSAGTLSADDCERLAAAVRATLDRAITAGGSTLRDFVGASGELGYFQHSFRVYDRAGAPCSREGCGGTIERAVQSNRATYFCSRCQA